MQRSGTNQVLSIIRSHPQTCWPDGEFHQIFRPRFNSRESLANSLIKLADYSIYYFTSGDNLGPHSPPSDKAFTGWRAEWIKQRIARRTENNRREVQRVKNTLNREGFYPVGLKTTDRVVIKLVDYNVGLARDLSRLYRDAIFIGLIRNPIPVCEGQTSRGLKLDNATSSYVYFCDSLIALEKSGANLLTIKFEDMVGTAEATARRILAHCDLNPDAMRGFLLQDKRRLIDNCGAVTGVEKHDSLLPFSEIEHHMRSDSNAEAANRFDKTHARKVINQCGAVMRHFGYAVPAEGERL